MSFKIEQQKKLVKFLYRTQVETGVRLPAFFWGNAGVGKTAGIQQAVDELSEELGVPVAYFNTRLANKPDAGDLVGLMYNAETLACPECGTGEQLTVKDFRVHVREAHGADDVAGLLMQARTHFETDVEMTWSFPRDMPHTGPAILFLDEVNRGNTAVRDAVFSIMETGKFGVHQLPKDVLVVAAGNPPSDDYQVQDFDTEVAFMRRCIHIVIESDVHEYLNYGADVGMDPRILTAIAGNPEFLSVAGVDKSFLDTLQPSSASMSKVDLLLRSGLEKEFESLEVSEIISGILGKKYAAELLLRLSNAEQPPTPAEILDDFKNQKGRIVAYSAGESARMDLLMMANIGLSRSISKPLTESQIKNLAEYLETIPADTATGFFKMALPELRAVGVESQRANIMAVAKLTPGVRQMLVEIQTTA